MALVLFFTATLVVSLVGMAAVLGLKRYELTTGRVFLASARPALRAFFRRGLFWLERVLPALAAHGVRRLWSAGRAAARAGAARALLALEAALERGLERLRRLSARAPASGEASAFLREVAEHKKKLQEERTDE